MQEEVEGDGEAEGNDDRSQDLVIDAPCIACAGIAADRAGDHHVPAETPLYRSVNDESDHCNAIRDRGDDDLERVHLRQSLNSAKGERGHGEQACSRAEISDVIANAKEQDEQRDKRDVLGAGAVTLDATSYRPRHRSAYGEAGGSKEKQIRNQAQK